MRIRLFSECAFLEAKSENKPNQLSLAYAITKKRVLIAICYKHSFFYLSDAVFKISFL